jgi:uroporphyrinogen III methyltransferase/synthase
MTRRAPTSDTSLRGMRVAVTRPVEGADELTELLRARGAEVVQSPLLRLTGPHDPAPLQQAIRNIDAYDWIVFTSANAVRFVARGLDAVGRAQAPRARVLAVGPATSAAVTEELGWRVDVVPERYAGDAVVQAMSAADDLRGRRVLWPRARDAREAIRRDLTAAGALLDDPETYGTDPVPEAAHELALLLHRGELHALTFTSPSAVAALALARPRMGACAVAVIGPSTREAAEAASLPVHVEPADHTIPALVDELALFLARTRT